MKKKEIIAFSALLLTLPIISLALEPFKPGTDEYLQNSGLTEEQLTNKVATEDREPFISAAGEMTAIDPTGDVVSRWGTHPSLKAGWGDLTSASLKKDAEKQCWLFSLETTEDIPETISIKANYLFYIDRDGNTENNATTGARINTDYEVSVKYLSDQGWQTDLRWFNQETNFWAVDKETASTFQKTEKNITLCVPFTEISSEVTPTWRAAAAVSDDNDTQIDVVPGAGFPPPKGQTYPTWSTAVSDNSPSTNSNNLVNWPALGAVAGLAGLGILIKLIFWFIEKKKK